MFVALLSLGCGDGSADPDATAPSEAQLVISPGAHDFGEFCCNETQATFAVINPGGQRSGTIAASLDGADAGRFSIRSDTCSGTSLDPGTYCQVTVEPQPNTHGATVSASLHLEASPGGTVTAELSARLSVCDGPLVAPTTHDFGLIEVGQVSAAQVFTLQNRSGVATEPYATGISGADAAEFAVTRDTCDGASLPAAGICEVEVQFRPTSAGAGSTSLVLHEACAGQTMAVLSGTGLRPAMLELASATFDFGLVCVSPCSGPTQTDVTLTNSGDVSSGPVTVGLAGLNPDGFEVISDTCTGQILGPGASCTVIVGVSEIAWGDLMAELQLAATPGGIKSATLRAYNQCEGMYLSPTPFDFGAISIGSASVGQTFTITHAGGYVTSNLATTLIGPNPNDFGILADNCSGTTLAAGASCTVDVEFRPIASGNRQVVLDISASPCGGTVRAGIYGTALEPAAARLRPVRPQTATRFRSPH